MKRTDRKTGIVAVTGLCLLLVGCGGGGSSPSVNASPTPIPSPTPIAGEKVISVQQKIYSLSHLHAGFRNSVGTGVGTWDNLAVHTSGFEVSSNRARYSMRLESLDSTVKTVSSQVNVGDSTYVSGADGGNPFFFQQSAIPEKGQPDKQWRVVVLDYGSPVPVDGDPSGMVITIHCND